MAQASLPLLFVASRTDGFPPFPQRRRQCDPPRFRRSSAAASKQCLSPHHSHRRANVESIASRLRQRFTHRTQVYLQEDTFHGYRLEVPQNEIKVTKRQLVDMYKTMTEMRRMEMAADKLYKEKLIRGFCHLAIGQEAVSVGMESAIEQDDKVITSYRCHPFAVLRGGTVKGVIAELLGECWVCLSMLSWPASKDRVAKAEGQSNRSAP